MNKNEVLGLLETAEATERAAAVAMQNISATFSWSGLSETQQDQVTELLETMSTAAQERARRVRRLARQVEHGADDVL